MAISGMAIGALTMHLGRVIALIAVLFSGRVELTTGATLGLAESRFIAFFRYKELKRCSQACPDLREFDRTLTGQPV
jgi:hypothetical protein